MWIDSHCHLNHERIEQMGGASVIARRAKDEADVEGILNICCRISDEFPELLDTTRTLDNAWCTIGTHPHEASDEKEIAISQEKLVEMALSDSRIVGIGETGLDFYYMHASRDAQEENFRKHLRACVETDMPVVVHSRDADDDTIRLISEESGGGKLRGVLHCFSSSRMLAEAAIDAGFFVSFSGILTFKKSGELRSIAKDIPLENLLLETDAPYLAPEPHRKKTNEPSLMVHTGKLLAEIKGVSEEEIASITKENFFRLFDRAK